MSDEKGAIGADLQTIQEQVGYGHGTTCGYTDLGTVFILTDTHDPEGRPMQTLIEMKPDRARAFIKSLEEALKAIETGADKVQ